MRRNISKVRVVGEWRELAEDRRRWRSIVVKTGAGTHFADLGRMTG